MKKEITDIEFISNLLSSLGYKHSKSNNNVGISKIELPLNNAKSIFDKQGRFFITNNGLFNSHGSLDIKLRFSNIFYLLNNYPYINHSIEELAEKSGLSTKEVSSYINNPKINLSKEQLLENKKLKIDNDIRTEAEVELFWDIIKKSKHCNVGSSYIEGRSISSNVINNNQIYTITNSEELLNDIEASIYNGDFLRILDNKISFLRKYNTNEDKIKSLESVKKEINSKEYSLKSITSHKLDSFPTLYPVLSNGYIKNFMLREVEKINPNKYTQIGSTNNIIDKSSNNDNLVICEGQMDYLTLKTYYEENKLPEPSFFVLLKATSYLTKKEQEYIKSFNGNITMMLDNDVAGKQATNKIMDIILEDNPQNITNVNLFLKYLEQNNIVNNDINDLYNLDKNKLNNFLNTPKKYSPSKQKDFTLINKDNLPKDSIVLENNRSYHESELLKKGNVYIYSNNGYVLLDDSDITKFLWEDKNSIISLFYTEDTSKNNENNEFSYPDSYSEFRKYIFSSISSLYPDLDLNAPDNKDILNRIKQEMSIIEKIDLNYQNEGKSSNDFFKYFVLNQKLTNSFESKGVIYDIRGSAENFVLLSLLGIVKENINSIKEKCNDPLSIPERFLNPEQLSMPDIDYELPTNMKQELQDIKKDFNMHLPLVGKTINGLANYSTHSCKHYIDVPGTSSNTVQIPKTAKELDTKGFLNVDLLSYGNVMNRYQKEFDLFNKNGDKSFIDFKEYLDTFKNIDMLTILTNELPHATGMTIKNLVNLNKNIKSKIPKFDTLWNKKKDSFGNDKNVLYIKNINGEFINLNDDSILDKKIKVDPKNIFKKPLTDIYNYSNILNNKDDFLSKKDIDILKSINISSEELTIASALNRPFASKTVFNLEINPGKNSSPEYLSFFEKEGNIISTCGNFTIDLSSDFSKSFFLNTESRSKKIGLFQNNITSLNPNIKLPFFKLEKNQKGHTVVNIKKELFAENILRSVNNNTHFSNFPFLDKSGGYITYQEEIILFFNIILKDVFNEVSPDWQRNINIIRKIVSKSAEKITQDDIINAKNIFDELKKTISSIQDKDLRMQSKQIFNNQFNTFLSGSFLFAESHAKHVGLQAKNVGNIIKNEPATTFPNTIQKPIKTNRTTTSIKESSNIKAEEKKPSIIEIKTDTKTKKSSLYEECDSYKIGFGKYKNSSLLDISKDINNGKTDGLNYLQYILGSMKDKNLENNIAIFLIKSDFKLPFGKFKGSSLLDLLNPDNKEGLDYLKWLQGSFSKDLTKNAALNKIISFGLTYFKSNSKTNSSGKTRHP